jgi:hypothetical protein
MCFYSINENTIKSKTNSSHALLLTSWMNHGNDDIEFFGESKYILIPIDALP